MSDISANWQIHRHSTREMAADPRADRILALADRRAKPALSASGELRPATMDKMDRLALLVAAIMAIGPLFAAFVGAMMRS